VIPPLLRWWRRQQYQELTRLEALRLLTKKDDDEEIYTRVVAMGAVARQPYRILQSGE